ncbi:MAG: CDP-alcohol phosphatidyltransferase family protein, partial [Gemmatimonadaceae bacterium]
MPRGALLTTPNLLSLSRLGLAAAFPFLEGRAERAAVVAAAALTDFLDGFLARRSHTASRWGALLDPVADRMFVFVAVCTYLFRGEITTTQYFVFISRDLMTAVGFLVAKGMPSLRDVTFQARLGGKVVTVLQLLLLLVVPLAPSAVGPLVVAIGAASAWAIADYTAMLWRARA